MIPEIEARPYPLFNPIQNYSWGSRGQNAFIPELLEIEAESHLPYAELWIGAHPSAPSQILLNGNKYPLNKVINAYPELILGKTVSHKFSRKLPFLFKVLSAREALSIQTHPDKKTAEYLHQKDPQHYPDDNHKPEIAIAIDSLKALVGFRQEEEIRKVLKKYPEIGQFIGQNIISEYMTGDSGEKAFKGLFELMMTKAEKEPASLDSLCSQMAFNINRKENPSERDHLFIELRGKYGADIGLIVIYFLNLINLKKGEAVFLKAGVPHAYLAGNIIECMANSDNVVRAGLTPKYKDIETLVKIADYSYGSPEIQKPASDSGKIVKYKAPVKEFTIFRYQFDSGEELDINTEFKIEILLSMEGHQHILTPQKNLKIKRGQSVLLPGCLERYRVQSEKHSLLFRVTI